MATARADCTKSVSRRSCVSSVPLMLAAEVWKVCLSRERTLARHSSEAVIDAARPITTIAHAASTQRRLLAPFAVTRSISEAPTAS